MRALRVGGAIGTLALACGLPGCASAADADAAAGPDDPARYIVFVEDFTAQCVTRNGVQLLVKSTHPSRRLRVWLDRYHMGSGTGDRSRTDLAPGGEPEALGCSRTATGTQEWRIVRSVFLD